MHDRTDNAGSILNRFFGTAKACTLWLYLIIAVFVWYGARLVPEGAVGFRIAAGAVSDQVWLPLGMMIWYVSLDWVWGMVRPPMSIARQRLRRLLLVCCCAGVLVLVPEPVFLFLPVPIIIMVVRAVVQIRLFREGTAAFAAGLPFWSMVLLTCLYYNWLLVPFHPEPVPVNDGASDLSILTYNIYRRARTDRRQQIVDTIKNADADIVCMVEVLFGHDEELFREELGDRYPYMAASRSMRGVRTNSMILSKFPVRAYRPVFENWSHGPLDFAFYTATVDSVDVTIVNFHLQTVGHYFETLPYQDGAIQDRLVHSSEQDGHIDRTKYAQVRSICEYLGSQDGPIIVCGDMNDTANGRVYRLFRESFEDVYASVGWGLGTTFGRTWLLNKKRVRELPLSSLAARDFIRIDYILAGGGVLPRSARVIKSAGGSDHRPVMAVVHLPG